MSIIRSFSLPRFHSSRHQDTDTTMEEAPTVESTQNQTWASHSRNSSAASSNSIPVTPIFISRGHHRWTSSTSTLATTPDSPVSMVKPTLHDLVEHPSEREDALHGLSHDLLDDALCICDSTLCEHRQPTLAHPAAAVFTPEWCPGDDSFSESDWNSEPSLKRRRSGDCPTTDGGIAARLSRRFPSLSRRNKREPTSLYLPPSNFTIHSAPASRAPSVRSVPTRRAYPQPPSERGSNSSLVHFPLIENDSEQASARPSRDLSSDPQAIHMDMSSSMEEPIDRQGMTATPLLPPMMDDIRGRSSAHDDIVSPLQSPTIADMPMSAHVTAPVSPAYPTPPLSAKPSTASFHPTRAARVMSDVIPMSLSDETDPWAMRLGHANFYIYPEPYMPVESTLDSCKRLLEDWEAARSEYLRQAVRISEHYGQTSLIYQLSEEKWAGIDAQWRGYHERANVEAQAHGEAPVFQPLAENQQVCSQFPTLNDPSHPAKFPRIEDAEIVGPMVQYAKVQRKPSKKKAFLRIFTDRASLLGGLRR